MANRRMFSKELIQSDKFFSMSIKSQLLYFHIGLLVDDDGFSNNYRMYMNVINADEENLYELQKQGYIYVFESGVLVVRDFLQSNQIRKDRKVDTIYQDELSLINVRNNRYFIDDNQVATIWQPDDNQVTTKRQPNDGIGKESIDKISVDKINNIPNINSISNGGDEENKELNKNDYIKKIIDEWNKIPELENISNREKDVEVIISNYGVKNTLKVIDNIKYSKFLRGMTNNSTWKVSLKWIIPKKNFEKILKNGFNRDMTDFEVQKIEDEQALLKQFPKPIIAKQ